MADLFLFVTFGDLSLGFTKYIHNSLAGGGGGGGGGGGRGREGRRRKGEGGLEKKRE